MCLFWSGSFFSSLWFSVYILLQSFKKSLNFIYQIQPWNVEFVHKVSRTAGRSSLDAGVSKQLADGTNACWLKLCWHAHVVWSVPCKTFHQKILWWTSKRVVFILIDQNFIVRMESYLKSWKWWVININMDQIVELFEYIHKFCFQSLDWWFNFPPQCITQNIFLLLSNIWCRRNKLKLLTHFGGFSPVSRFTIRSPIFGLAIRQLWTRTSSPDLTAENSSSPQFSVHICSAEPTKEILDWDQSTVSPKLSNVFTMLAWRALLKSFCGLVCLS